jgi:hypothetical protein
MMGPCCECMSIHLTVCRDCEKSNRPRGGKPLARVDSGSAADSRGGKPRCVASAMSASPPLASWHATYHPTESCLPPLARMPPVFVTCICVVGHRLRPDLRGTSSSDRSDRRPLLLRTGRAGRARRCAAHWRTAHRALKRAARCRGRQRAACGTVCLPITAYFLAACSVLCCLHLPLGPVCKRQDLPS